MGNDTKDRSVIAFLPCRARSQRVPRKNTREFDSQGRSLFDIKIRQLLGCSQIDRIVVSTNDPEIKDSFATVQHGNEDRLVIDHRPDHLCSSSTSTDDLIRYVPSIISEGHILWTHVTSPFVNSDDYSQIIDSYLGEISNNSCSSLMTVTRIKSFLWNESGPINYDREIEKWPRTQTLPSIFEVNSAAFMISSELMKKCCDRITTSVKLFELQKIKSIDIDYIEDFDFAATVYNTFNEI